MRMCIKWSLNAQEMSLPESFSKFGRRGYSDCWPLTQPTIPEPDF